MKIQKESYQIIVISLLNIAIFFAFNFLVNEGYTPVLLENTLIQNSIFYTSVVSLAMILFKSFITINFIFIQNEKKYFTDDIEEKIIKGFKIRLNKSKTDIYIVLSLMSVYFVLDLFRNTGIYTALSYSLLSFCLSMVFYINKNIFSLFKDIFYILEFKYKNKKH